MEDIGHSSGNLTIHLRPHRFRTKSVPVAKAGDGGAAIGIG